MKKITRIIAILIFTFTICLSITSCDLSGLIGGSFTPPASDEEKENLIYNSKSELYVIVGEGATADLAFNLMNEIDSARNAENPSQYVPVSSDEHKHEIVIGNTERPISVTAKSQLERINKNTENELAYLIYSNGSSVAIVFDSDERGVTEGLALDYFLEKYTTDELIAAKGTLYSYKYDIIEDHYRVLDNEYRNAQWEELRKALDPSFADSFVNSMKELYALYTPNVVEWLANLYEPNICICYGLYGEERCDGTNTPYCGNAGIYYSNSGRDTIGYLPDLESTSQALGFTESSGMSYMFGNRYSNWLPDEIKTKLGLFAQQLQHEDGFFYHPQWGRDFIINENKDSRRSRDLGHAQNLLGLAGLKPFYNTPTGVEGSNPEPVSKIGITSPLGRSTVSAVSKAVLTAGSHAEHLENEKTFKEYLESYDIRHNSYSVGNRLGSQMSQIIARDEEIGTENDPTPLMDELMDYLIKNQNPETGCWNWKYKEEGKPHEGAELYESVNGLLKIVNDFTLAGREMPYAEEAAMTAMEAIVDPLPIDAVTSLYNTWYAFGWIVDNLRECGGDKGDETADEIVAILKEAAVEGIAASKKKIAVFMHDDGSFSYGMDKGVPVSAQTSQGCQVALPHTSEGDVNATVISVNGIKNHIFAALELDEYKPILFGEAERLIYLNTIKKAQSVIKNEVELTGEPIDFDYDEVGVPSESLEYELGKHEDTNEQLGSAVVVANPKGEGNVTKISTFKGCGDYVTIPNQTNSELAKTYVFESDFLLESSTLQDESYFIQFFMGQKNYTCYFFTLTLKDGKIIANEHSASSYSLAVEETLGEVGTLGKWFRIKVEYYYSESMDDVRIKFWYDDDLEDDNGMKLLAVTDNFYDSTGNKYLIGQAEPCKYFQYTRLYMMKNGEAVLYMDNCMAYKTQSEYTQVTDKNNQPPINIDPPDSPEKIYDFDDGTLDPDIKLDGNEGSVTVKDGALNLTEGADVIIPVNTLTKGSRCVSFGFDIDPSDAVKNSAALRFVGLDGGVQMFGIELAAREDPDGKYLTLVEYNGTANGEELSGVRIPFGKVTSVRLDYFHKEDMILIYVNDEFVAASGLMYTDGIKRTMDELLIESVGTSYDISLDNIKVERNTKLFLTAVQPTTPSAPNTFEGADENVKTAGGATVSDGVLNLNSNSGAASAAINVHTRAKLYNVFKFSADFKLEKALSNGEIERLNFTDDLGNIVFSLALVKSGNMIELCQVSEGGMIAEPIYSYEAASVFNITLEIYKDKKMVHIIESGNVKAKTSVFYNPENLALDISKMNITSGTAKSNVTVDNLIFERYYGAYIKATLTSKVTPDEKLSEGLHFELSNSGKLPTGNIDLGYLNSPQSAIRIEQTVNTLMTDKNSAGEWSNVIVMDTGAGANDSLMFVANEPMVSYSCVTFEADVLLDPGNNGEFIQMFMSDKSRNNKVIMLQMGVDGDGNITLSEMSSNSFATSIENKLQCNVKAGEWFKIRVEFYKGSKGNVRLKYFINGTLIAVSDNFYGSKEPSATPNTLLECVNFMSLSSAYGSIYVDNVSLKGSSATCTDTPTVENSPQ